MLDFTHLYVESLLVSSFFNRIERGYLFKHVVQRYSYRRVFLQPFFMFGIFCVNVMFCG